MNYLAVLYGGPAGNVWVNVPVTVHPLTAEAIRQVEREVAQVNGWDNAVLINLIPLDRPGLRAPGGY